MKLVHNVQKKQHRERAQPLERRRLGLLEKKKDYKLRAQDYHRKQDALKILKAKAAQRNPDEYYHAMTRKKTDSSGIQLSERDEETLTNDQIKLLKTQDSTYIKNLRSEELKKLKKLEKNIAFKSTGNHTIFVDTVKDKLEFDSVKHFKTDKNLINNRENRLKLNQLNSKKSIVNSVNDDEDKEALDTQRLKNLKRYKRILEKTKELQEVDERMITQLEGMKNGSKRKITDSKGRTAYQFKKERRR